MLPNKNLMDLPLEQWPADWNTLQNKLRDLEPRFWRELVSTRLSTAPLKDDSEATYKQYFREFWEAKPGNDIIKAASKGYDVYLKHLLSRLSPTDKCALINKKLPIGDTALHVAARKGHVSVAKILLDEKADPNAIGDHQETPLHAAAYSNSADIAALLLESGASVSATRFDNEPPLHVAVLLNAPDVAAVIIKQRPDQLKAKGREHRTALYAAAKIGRIEIMDKLLCAGADVNESDLHTGLSVLHVAAIQNRPDMIKLLVKEHNAEINLKDRNGYTPLDRCALQHIPSFEAAQTLIEYNADINAALDFLVHRAHQTADNTLAMAKLLITKGANPDPAFEHLDKIKDRLQTEEYSLYKYLKELRVHKNAGPTPRK